MQDVRSALATILENDTTLVSYLGGGTASIMAERDLVADGGVAFPLVTLAESNGTRPYGPCTPDMTTEEWTIYAYDQDNGFANIESILNRCKKLLHKQGPAVNAAIPSNQNIGRSVLACTFVWYTPKAYDNSLKADYAGVRFRLYIQEIAYAN